jgi:AraC family transcriptional regulator
MGAIRFRPGEFYGAGDARRSEGGFSVVSLSSAGGQVEVHAHDTVHFVLVLAGGYISTARDGPEVSITPGLVFNPAGVVHRDRFLGGKGRFLALSLSEQVERAAGDEIDLQGPARWLPDPIALRAANQLEAALRAPRTRPVALEGAAWRLVASISGRPVSKGAPPPWIGRVLEMAHESPDAELSVPKLATCAGVHPVHLARVFRDWLGCSPGEYLRGRRLERATAMIGKSALALAEVAADTGFVDQAHMTRAFRDRLGVTPAAMRRNVARVQDREGAEV